MKIDKHILKKIPKVELHCHLDGSVRPETIIEIAKKQNKKLPVTDPAELKKYIQVPEGCHSLTDFLKVFDFFLPFLKNPEAVEKISYELCGDCAAENIRYIEVRFAPFLHTAENFSMEDVVKMCIKGLSQGGRDFHIKTGLILCCMRFFPEEVNMATVELAKKYFGKGVVALDLAGDESLYPTKIFSGPFGIAAKYKIPFTLHAGEAAGPESISAALALGASRIGHGTNLIKDKLLLEKFKNENIPVEVCITSNVQTAVVKGFDSHPVAEFYKKGLKVTLNTDDRSVSGIDLTNEYDIFVNRLGFGMSDLVKVIENGIDALFVSDREKFTLKKSFDKEFKNLEI